MKTLSPSSVVDLQAERFARRQKTVRLMPELDGTEALYDFGFGPGQLIARPIIAWSLSDEGSTAGLIAFDGELVRVDCLSSRFQGYFDPITGSVSREAPGYAAESLAVTRRYFSARSERLHMISPEFMGHRVAMFTSLGWQFKSIAGWRLNDAGDLAPLVEQTSTMTDPPVVRRIDGRKLRGYAGIVDANQAAQLDVGGPVEERFIGLRKLYLI